MLSLSSAMREPERRPFPFPTSTPIPILPMIRVLDVVGLTLDTNSKQSKRVKGVGKSVKACQDILYYHTAHAEHGSMDPADSADAFGFYYASMCMLVRIA